MSEFPNDVKYLSSHEWIRLEGDGTATVGISDHAQDSLGDLVYVELPEMDAELNAGDEAGVVESVKAASDIYTPMSGTIIAVNERLDDEPEAVNASPYEDGWIFKIRVSNTSEYEGLLSADDYQAQVSDD